MGTLLKPLIILFGKVFYYNSSIANTPPIFFIIYTSEMKQYLTQSADYYCSLECLCNSIICCDLQFHVTIFPSFCFHLCLIVFVSTKLFMLNYIINNYNSKNTILLKFNYKIIYLV